MAIRPYFFSRLYFTPSLCFHIHMLKLRQMIPPVTARTLDGRLVRAWDFKQKKNLVLAFLHAECVECEDWLRGLVRSAAQLNEHEAVALAIFPATPQRALENLAPPIVVVADMSGRSQRSFLGDDAFSTAGLERAGVLVADRFGELFAQWLTDRQHKLPAVEEIIDWLSHIQVACEECGAPTWVVE
jgi:peroxiredoxin